MYSLPKCPLPSLPIAHQIRMFLSQSILLGLFCGILGCGSSSLSGPPIEPSPDKPKHDLDYAMERLQHALSLYRPSGNSGLRIKRDMQYDYQAPTPSKPDPTATVTINSLTIFQHNQLSSSKPKSTKEKKSKDDNKNLVGLDPALIDPYLEDGDEEYFELRDKNQAIIAENERTALSANARVKARRKQETKEFKLVYKQDKWQLLERPEVEHEALWFEYALPE